MEGQEKTEETVGDASEERKQREKPKKNWGPLLPLAEEVTRGGLDGFEVPFEAVGFVPEEWPDGLLVVRYVTPNGFLLFREGAHENFGYFSAKEFSSAAKRKDLRAKTPEGALSLGRTRLTEGKPVYISLLLKDLWINLYFLAESGEEAMQMRRILQRLVPDGTIRMSENLWRLLLMGGFHFDLISALQRFDELNQRQRRGLMVLGVLAMLCLFLIVAQLVGWIHGWFDILGILVFLVAVVVLFPLLSPHMEEVDGEGQELVDGEGSEAGKNA